MTLPFVPTLTITRCRQLWHWTSSERTPFWRRFARCMGSIGSLRRGSTPPPASPVSIPPVHGTAAAALH
jgi:hypothetical protein